jgi:osmotically-inducible protein OsmY
MRVSESLEIIADSMFMVAGLAACDKPGPAETAGKKIDQTADTVGQKIGAATDQVGDKLSETGAETGVAIDDTAITAKVKAAIFAEPGLKTLKISVDTVKGVVTLSGSVDTQQNRNNAESLTAAVAGPTKVENRLVLK